MLSVPLLVSGLSFLFWTVNAAAAARVIRAVPLVADLDPPPPPAWPKVSIIIPACNEAELIEDALRSRLGEGYPNAEYIVVDDRSTDGTGEIIDRIAAEDPRVVALHVTELPAGWLGKLNALHQGVTRATGDFILFSDADVHHEPGTLSRIIAHAEETGLDSVSVLPTLWSKDLVLDAFMNNFARLFVLGSRAWNVPNPRSKVSVGGGNFNLVRRSALERAGGLEPLRLEIVDDIALGQALKWSGARQGLLNARGLVSLYFYRSLGEAIRGMEKNAFAAIGRLDVARFLGFLAVFVLLDVGWVAGLAADPAARALAGAALGLSVGTHVAIAAWLRRPVLPSLLSPLATLIVAFAALRSMALALARGGVEWRGTRYSLRELRAGMRYVLG